MTVTAPERDAPASALRAHWLKIVALYAGVFAVLLAAGNLAWELMPREPPPHGFPEHPIIGTLARWDTGWYFHIAEQGYFYNGPGQQSAAAFFPAYPAAMRVVAFAVGDALVAGVIVTIASALLASLLLFRWVDARFGTRTAWFTLLLLYLYPFAYFLFGTVYSDALFLVSTLAAFALLEDDKPVLAGLAGTIACAGRPVGLAVVVGLAAVAIQRRGSLRKVKVRDAGVLLAGLGFVAFLAFLWWRFDDPMAFSKVQTAPGWNRQVNLEMIAKVDFYRRWRDFGPSLVNWSLTLQAVLSVAALASLPLVWRRVGWGYAVYVMAVLGIPLATSSDFLAMGRYILPAFPVFAVVGELLARPRRLVAPASVLAVSACGLLYFTTLFARWYLVS